MAVLQIIIIIILLVVFGLISNATGDDIKKRIKDRYNDVAEKCKHNKPAYECSGIMIRGVNNDVTLAWYMKHLNKQKDAFSLAYLRRDQTFSSFPKKYESGFIIYPHSKTPRNKNTYKVYCSFPIDGWTDNREGHGCGKYKKDTSGKSDHCRKQNIKTFGSWKSHFKEVDNGLNDDFKRRQCAFDMTTKSAAKYFAASLKAHRYIKSRSKKYAYKHNELRMHAWNENKANKLPIEAFFYLTGSSHGQRLAEKYQDEFHDKSGGEIVPIVGIQLPTAEKKFEVYFYKRTPHGNPPRDHGVPPRDHGVPPRDHGIPPRDYGNLPLDYGNFPHFDYDINFDNSPHDNRVIANVNVPPDYINPRNPPQYGNLNLPNDYENSPHYDYDTNNDFSYT